MRKSVVIGLLLAGLFVSVQAEDVNKMIKNIQKTYDKMDNFSADFRQVDIFKLTGSRSEATGRIFIKDGVKYRFESEDQVVVTDGETVWTYNALSNQLLIDEVRENSGALVPRDLLYKYPKTYFATLLGEEEQDGKTVYEIKLDPKENIHGYIKTIRLWVQDNSWLISKIETTDLNGNRSLFEITGMEWKEPLDERLFQYEPQAGVEVVDMR